MNMLIAATEIDGARWPDSVYTEALTAALSSN